VRAALERVLSADRLDLWYRRTAQKQYTRALLFSTVYELMSPHSTGLSGNTPGLPQSA